MQSDKEQTGMKEMVTRLGEEYPQADKNEIVRRFLMRAREDDEHLKAAVEYAVVSTWNTIEIEAGRREQLIMLDLIMPNGKRMRYCTGAEMEKFGNAFLKIAERLGEA
jgi:hypothetical protein